MSERIVEIADWELVLVPGNPVVRIVTASGEKLNIFPHIPNNKFESKFRIGQLVKLIGDEEPYEVRLLGNNNRRK